MPHKVQRNWSQFKALIDANGKFQWNFFELPDRYDVFGIQGSIFYIISIMKDGGADVLDFENNYKSNPTADFVQWVESVLYGRKTNGESLEVEITDDRKLKVEAILAAGGADQDVHPVDANGLNLDVADGVSTPANTRGIMIAGKDEGGMTRIPTITVDPQDNKKRVEITGKVSVSTPDAPPSSTPRTVEANTPLGISATSTTNYVIPNGVTFTLLSVTAGSEGDPNERGNKVEVSYVDAASVVHLIERIYISSQTIQIYPNTDRARDETIMVGNGTTTQLRIVRYRLGGGTTECDVIVRGFEQ